MVAAHALPSAPAGAAGRGAAPPLRIALVTETYPPEVNGVAATVAQLVQGLLARGHTLQLVRPLQPGEHGLPHPRPQQHRQPQPQPQPAPGGLLTELLLPGLPIPRYPQLRMGLPATSTLLAAWQQQRPDLVHLATEGPLGWSAQRAAQRLGLPVTSDYRTNFDAYSRHYGIGWLRRPIGAYLRRFHNRTLATMVPTPVLQRTLLAQGFENVSVVARGVDTRQFDPRHRSAALRAAWGVAPHTPVVAHVGRLAPEKNLGLLLGAFEAMRAVQPAARLLLVGDGPARGALQQRCPDAIFAGLRHGTDLAAHYASADAFVFPSMTETFGNVTPEAMASGLPVLAFDHAAAGQLIEHGHSGLLATLGDEAGFLALAARLAGQPAWARGLGLQARQQMSGCGWDAVVAQVEALMHLACKRHLAAAALSPAAGSMAGHAAAAVHPVGNPPG